MICAIGARIRAITPKKRAMQTHIRAIHPKIRGIEYNKESATK